MGGQVIQTPALGIGQTWQDMTASRATGTNYTNTTGRSMLVNVRCTQNNATMSASLSSDGVQVSSSAAGLNYSMGFVLSAIIPAGAVYRIDLTNAALTSWKELR